MKTSSHATHVTSTKQVSDEMPITMLGARTAGFTVNDCTDNHALRENDTKNPYTDESDTV